IGQALRDIDEQAVLREPVDFSRWSGAPNFGLQMFRAQDSAELKQSLNSQFNAMAAVAERHAPALEWLQAQQSSLATADYNAFVRFSALNAELQKFKVDNPASTAAQLAKLVGNDFNQMDIGSCADILNGVLLPSSRSDLATRLVDLRQGALGRCQSLQQQQAAQAWKDLADYFNQYLAGRFPFAYSLEAADAEPGRVRHLLQLMETRLPQVREGLAQVRSPDLPAAEDFVRRLEQAQRWLGPLFERDKSGLLGVALDIDWRSDRSLERGADQVIAWSLYSGDQESRFPGAQDKGLTWNVGDPLKIMLRWAKNGSQRPADDPRQASLAVADLEAGWSYQGSWALLRMMRAHFSRQRPPNVDYTEFPLVLQLPVYAPYSPENEARMFLRLSLMSLGGKTPLSIQPLPVRAPQSPFATLLPATVASTGGTP
ncbi:type VI secretion system protein ImpL, partial [Pseudomonas aeruginosa]